MVDLVVLPAWGEIEADYRAGIKTLRQIASVHGYPSGVSLCNGVEADAQTGFGQGAQPGPGA